VQFWQFLDYKSIYILLGYVSAEQSPVIDCQRLVTATSGNEKRDNFRTFTRNPHNQRNDDCGIGNLGKFNTTQAICKQFGCQVK